VTTAQTAGNRQLVTVVLLLAATAILLALPGNAPVKGSAGIRMVLPERVGRYEARDILFCQNEQCLKSFVSTELENQAACPSCGGKLDDLSLGEKLVLPSDTIVLKKQYVHPSGRKMHVSVVLSGEEQKSIHRPQQCLPGQGHAIARNQVLDIPIPNREPLKVMLLDLTTSVATLQGDSYRGTSSFAYWFVGQDRETPYHLERLFWMAADRIFRNVAHRWAYIAIATDRREGSEEHIKQLTTFIATLHPLIQP